MSRSESVPASCQSRERGSRTLKWPEEILHRTAADIPIHEIGRSSGRALGLVVLLSGSMTRCCHGSAPVYEIARCEQISSPMARFEPPLPKANPHCESIPRRMTTTVLHDRSGETSIAAGGGSRTCRAMKQGTVRGLFTSLPSNAMSIALTLDIPIEALGAVGHATGVSKALSTMTRSLLGRQ